MAIRKYTSNSTTVKKLNRQAKIKQILMRSNDPLSMAENKARAKAQLQKDLSARNAIIKNKKNEARSNRSSAQLKAIYAKKKK